MDNNLKKPQQPREWTESEEKFLEENYTQMTGVEISKILNRSKKSIYAKARKMGLSQLWTTEEEEYLIKNYSEQSMTTLIRHFKRSEGSIRTKARRLGVLRDTYSDGLLLSTGDVGRALGLARNSILRATKKGFISSNRKLARKKRIRTFAVQNVLEFMCNYPEKWIHKHYDRITIQSWLLDNLATDRHRQVIQDYMKLPDYMRVVKPTRYDKECGEVASYYEIKGLE